MIMTMSHFTFIGLSVICTMFHVFQCFFTLQYLQWTHKIRFFFSWWRDWNDRQWMVFYRFWTRARARIRSKQTKIHLKDKRMHTTTCDEFIHIENARSFTTKNSERWKIITFPNLYLSKPIWMVWISFRFLWHSFNVLVYTRNLLLSTSIFLQFTINSD